MLFRLDGQLIKQHLPKIYFPVSGTDSVSECMKVTQSCLTLFRHMDCTVHEILQARILEWVAYPFSSRSYQARI